MTDEEKKAIDYLQLCYDISIIDNESLSKLGIALNLIEKQKNDYQSCMDYADSLNKDIGELLLKLEKQEKIINEMALYIAGCDTDEDICKKWKPNNSCEDNGISCKECLIEYFEKEVGE